MVSELRRPRPHPVALAWIEDVVEEGLYLCAVTIGEIESGIEITREQDTAKAAELDEWVGRVLDMCQVLAVDAATLREWARLMHRLTVITRNVRDFERLGVATLDPFTYEDRRG